LGRQEFLVFFTTGSVYPAVDQQKIKKITNALVLAPREKRQEIFFSITKILFVLSKYYY
jgi:hypothetical protein